MPTHPYHFDQIIDRRHTLSIKHRRYEPDVIPMWVADMDFPAPPAVLEALRAQVEHGIYGYDFPYPEVLGAVADRLARLYGWQVQPEEIVPVPGLVSGFNIAARTVAQPGDSYLIHSPVYHPMRHLPDTAGLERLEAPLRLVTHGHTLHYDLDLDAHEALVKPNTRLFLFCHPHNPAGRIFPRAELEALAAFSERHNLIICSDEIHCELLLGGAQHLPIAALSPDIAARTITLIAPSKTFNIAGLSCGFAIIPDPALRKRYETVAHQLTLHVTSTGLVAAQAAYGPETDDWLKQLLGYLTANRDTLVQFVAERLPGVRTSVPEATYLAWLDCRELNLEPSPYEFFLKKARVASNDGAVFGAEAAGFVRLNFGCPRATLLEALERMAAALAAR